MKTEDYEHLLYETDGPVAVITIDRPERMNAIGPRTHRELIDAWDRFRVDEEALVGVLTGAGDRAFCAGGDLKSAFENETLAPESEADRHAHDRGERPGALGPLRWTDVERDHPDRRPDSEAVTPGLARGGLA